MKNVIDINSEEFIKEFNKKCINFMGVESVPFVSEGRFFTSVFHLGREDKKWGLSHGSIEENMEAIYSVKWSYTTDWNYIMAVRDKIQSKFYAVDILWCGICKIDGIDVKTGKTYSLNIGSASDDIRFSVIDAINQFLDYYNDINS